MITPVVARQRTDGQWQVTFPGAFRFASNKKEAKLIIEQWKNDHQVIIRWIPLPKGTKRTKPVVFVSKDKA